MPAARVSLVVSWSSWRYLNADCHSEMPLDDGGARSKVASPYISQCTGYKSSRAERE